MSAMQQSSRVVILIKALPQPSKTYGETVCCAGVTLGSGLIDQSQKMTVAAIAMAEKKVWAHLS